MENGLSVHIAMEKDTSWTSIGQMVKQTCEHCKGTGQMWAQK
jgi:Ribonuclease G/E